MKTEQTLLAELIPLLRKAGLMNRSDETPEEERLSATRIDADGSARQFTRIQRDGQPLCLAIGPASRGERDMAESRAAWQIGRHLEQKGIQVPALYIQDEESGILLCEDLADTRLYDIVIKTDFSDTDAVDRLRRIYEQTIEQLLAMQVEAAVDFTDNWCWDTPRYDRQVMLERESAYFLKSFWQDMLGQPVPEGIEEDFKAIADQAALAHAGFFLHRDFQSRNIMLKDNRIRIIDYQAGRRGPLAYDLASLLIDPYANLPGELQEHLLELYMEKLGRRLAVDGREFLRHYTLLALQRNLQIVGAFAFLSQARGKAFFAKYIRPSVAMLNIRLQDPVFGQRAVLRRTVETAAKIMDC